MLLIIQNYSFFQIWKVIFKVIIYDFGHLLDRILSSSNKKSSTQQRASIFVTAKSGDLPDMLIVISDAGINHFFTIEGKLVLIKIRKTNGNTCNKLFSQQ
jgi:hypothetical protein